MTMNGSVDGQVFVAYVREVLAPTLVTGDVVVMDNLGARKVKGAREAIEGCGARLIYLPPSSPDLNPIEKCWSRNQDLSSSSQDADAGSLGKSLERSLGVGHGRRCGGLVCQLWLPRILML